MTDTRERILLRAAYDLLRKCHEGPEVKDALAETVFYDDADCDGTCLANDIAYLLDLQDLDGL